MKQEEEININEHAVIKMAAIESLVLPSVLTEEASEDHLDILM